MSQELNVGREKEDVAAGAIWKIVGRKKELYYTLQEYVDEFYNYLVRHPESESVSIYPEALFGFRVNNHVDLDKYSEIGFHHPKNPHYYDLRNNDPKFLEICNGIWMHNKLDDQPLVYPYMFEDGTKALLVLDGATRLSAIGYGKGRDQNMFRRISVQVFRGNEKEARFEMIRRNYDGNKRDLNNWELANSIHRLYSSGNSKEEICAGFGWKPERVSLIDSFLSLRNVCDDVKRAIASDKINRAKAFAIASLGSEALQKQALEHALSGERVSAAKLKVKFKPAKESLNQADQIKAMSPEKSVKAMESNFAKLRSYFETTGLLKEDSMNDLFADVEESINLIRQHTVEHIQKVLGDQKSSNQQNEDMVATNRVVRDIYPEASLKKSEDILSTMLNGE